MLCGNPLNILSNKYGLSDRDMQTLHDILYKYPEVLLVNIFRSRAKGTSKPGSDIDLSIMNMGANSNILHNLKNEFEESSLPYKVDLVDFHTLTNPDFAEHIKRVGAIFYQREDGNYSIDTEQ